MKILFVMEKWVNAGSIQAVASYVRAGEELGHTLALYGKPDPKFPGIRFSTSIDTFDHVVILFESALRWISGLRLPQILSGMPRHRRSILDADGMCNPVITVDGYDRNHAAVDDRLEWLAYYDRLADRILQPTLEPSKNGVIPLPFYGYDPSLQVSAGSAQSKPFDIMYLGHNWWRWKELDQRLLPAVKRVRPSVSRIAFVGAWWNGTPPPFSDSKVAAGFQLDSDRLRELHIELRPAVPYTDVVTTMSQGRINIMTQRPLLRHLRFLTSKYFEVFCADTIPVLMLDSDHAESVYGSAGRELAMGEDVAGKLLDALHRPEHYRDLVEEVRRHLIAHHSYRRRVEDLIGALEAQPKASPAV